MTDESQSGGGTHILEARDLVKNFGGLRAIDHCSFRVREGTITGLIGPNGAGKSTMFDLLTGFTAPDAGQVFAESKDITGLPPHRVFDRKICRTFQVPREHGTMTVLENLMLVASDQAGEQFWNNWFRPGLVRRQEREIRDRAFEVLEFVDLTRLAHELASRLSGGQKKLLELARTLMAEPRLVLLDEPAAGVNRTLMRKLAENIEYLRAERGITFLLIEHDMDLVMELCDPVIVMSEGRQLMEGTPNEVRRDPRVLEAYLGGQYGAA